jgi:predicted O-linked N-acetylglucosamine transferase (SPINDLY family)
VPAPYSAHLWRWLAGWSERKGLPGATRAFLRFAGNSADIESALRLAKDLLDRDENREAAAWLAEFVERAPRNARAWMMLGAARRRLGSFDEAIEATRRALEIDPRYAEARSNLGETLLVRGEASAALAEFDRALEDSPRLIAALNNRAAALYEVGRFQDAEAAARGAIEAHPEVPELHVNLGNILVHTAKARGAVKAYRRALELDPGCAEAYLSLAMLHGELQRLGALRDYLEREIEVKGESAQRLASLAIALHACGDIAGAEQTARKLLDLQPGNMAALMTLAGCVSARGDHLQGIRLQEQVLELYPQHNAPASNIAFESTYVAEYGTEEVFERHRDWARRFEAPLHARAFSHARSSEPERRLRIGYVSGDFGNHPVGFLLRDIVRRHDHAAFEIHCFSMMRADDDITRAIRGATDHWHDVLLDTDDEVAERIHDEKVDILVDLSGHTAYHRLCAIARRPAPVQATWIGYFHSTGLESIDYFITDPHTSPKGCGQLFSETPLWLPHSRFSYSPPEYAPPVAAPPVSSKGRVTFGSFNRLEKLVPAVLDAWAEILRRVPEARLLLKGRGLVDGSEREWLVAAFRARGIREERLDLRDRTQHVEMLIEYGEVDIALDTFPFNGGMTTLEALWMGVPVATWAGRGVVSRQTHSALANIGLAELAFPTLETYVGGAVALANDVERLAVLRSEIRPRMAASPICRPEEFARDLENLYRRMWRAWCDGGKLPSDIR